jgi:hypothetical protein
METIPPPLPSTPTDGWWRRHWKWAVPALGAAGLSLFAAFMLLAVSAVFGMMKSSDAYKLALQRVQASPASTSALGTPIREGWLVMGNIQVNGPSGAADLQIPVSGPTGEGDVFVEATRSAGAWSFQTLTLQLDADGKRIDLLEEAPTP